ncbi:MAG TPA: hypothetical protein VEP50_10270 [bacterium]|nr:hypothetical protein [bacterium]
MSQTQSHSLHAAFGHFREITRSLRDLDADGHVPFLKYELLQALERANQFQERGSDLQRQLQRLRAR